MMDQIGGNGTMVTMDFGGLVGQVLEFLPEEVVVDESLNVRFGSVNKKEAEKIERLAQTIAEVGQLQEAGVFPVVTVDGEVECHLFMGNRRCAAIALHNAGLKKGEAPL